MITAPRLLVESTQFQNQRIGVVRAYQGGAAERGQAASAQALMQGADQIAGLAFRYAAEDAEQQGMEMAQSAQRASVMAIDPATGEPVAMSQMGGMGRIGSEAYRRVINARFQQNIDEEIRNRSAVLAEQYGNDPDGIGLYTTAMSDYISSMSENATGQWRGFIEEAGTNYLNRTRASITVSQMRRSRSAMAAGGRQANANALSALEATIGQLGPAAFGEAGPAASGFVAGPAIQTTRGAGEPALGFSVTGSTSGMQSSIMALEAGQGTERPTLSFGDIGIAGAISQEAQVGIADAIEAEIAAPPAMEGWNLATREAAARGMTIFYTRQQDMTDPSTVRHLSRLRFMIGSGDVVGAMREAPDLAPYLQFMLSNAEALDDFDSFANGLFSDAINLAELESEATVAEADANALELSLIWQQNAEDGAYQTEARLRSMPPGQIVPTVEAAIAELSMTRAAIPGMRNEAQREASQNIIQSQVEATQRGLFDNLVQAMPNQDEIDRIRGAFASRNPNLLNAAERPVYDALERLERFDPEIFDAMDTEFGSYRESGGRFAQAEDEQAAREFVEAEILPSTNSFVTLRGEDVGLLRDDLLAALGSVPFAAEGVRNEALNAININAAQAELYQAFEQAREPSEVAAMRLYAETSVAPEGLNPESMAAIDRAREYTGQTGNTSAFRTATNTAADSVSRRITEEQRQLELRNNIGTVLSGTANARTSSARTASQEVLNREFRAAVVGAANNAGEQVNPQLLQAPADLFTNPEYLQNPIFQPMFDRLYNTPNYLPESLYNTFSSIGDGTILPGMETALSHWNQFRSGPTGRNPAINALSEDQIGMLDMLSEASAYFGPGEDGPVRFTEAVTAYNQIQYSETFQSRVESYLSQPLTDFLNSVEGFDTLSSDQRSAVRALSGHLIATSIAVPNMGSGANWLRRRLETQIGEATPSTGGTVIEFGPSGEMQERSRYALINTVPGYESDFVDYVRENITNLSDAPPILPSDMTLSFGERFVGALTRNVQADAEEYSFLVPFGEDSQGGITYSVFRMNTNTAEVSRVMRTDPEGVGLPLMISTKEQRFDFFVRRDAMRQRSEQLLRGDRTRELLGVRRFDPRLSSGSVGLPSDMLEAY